MRRGGRGEGGGRTKSRTNRQRRAWNGRNGKRMSKEKKEARG